LYTGITSVEKLMPDLSTLSSYKIYILICYSSVEFCVGITIANVS